MELWQQGGIHLVINRESQSFAQRYHTEHGLSVCAYGLSCPYVLGLFERATKLGYQIEYADQEHDTHGVAAITGPTGALFYLVDSNAPSPHWEREFVYYVVDPNSYLSRVDHVATTLPLDQVLEATLLYRALFQMQASPSVSLPDPLGLVKSQVIDSSGRLFAGNDTE